MNLLNNVLLAFIIDSRVDGFTLGFGILVTSQFLLFPEVLVWQVVAVKVVFRDSVEVVDFRKFVVLLERLFLYG